MCLLKKLCLLFVVIFPLEAVAGPVTNMVIDNITANSDGSFNFDWSYSYSSECAEVYVELMTTPVNVDGSSFSTVTYSGNTLHAPGITKDNSTEIYVYTASIGGWSVGDNYSVKNRIMNARTSSQPSEMAWQTYGATRTEGMGACAQSGSVPVPPIPTLASCTAASTSANVSLGQWYLSDLSTIGSTTQSKSVPISLNCTGNSNGTSVSASITAQGDSADPTHYIALSGGGAGGMAIEMLDQNSTILSLNKKFVALSSFTTGNYPLGWSARYIRTSNTMTEGAANSVVTVAFSYD